jgi:hypothetical protein
MTDTPDPMSSMGDQAHIVKGIIQRAPHSRLPNLGWGVVMVKSMQ